MSPIDIHNPKRRTELAQINFQKKFSENNAKVSCRFLDRLRLDNKSYGRIANYADCIRRILEIKDTMSESEIADEIKRLVDVPVYVFFEEGIDH